jgi:Flp pilus assembly protein TadG
MSIIFPAVILVILMMFQFSLYWHTANAAGVAAEQGVDAGQVFADDHQRAIDEAEAAADWILANTSRRGVPTASIDGNLLTVTVTAEAPRIVGIGSWRVRSVAEGRFETFVPADQR